VSGVRGNDPSGGSVRDRLAQSQSAASDGAGKARRARWLPDWLRAIFFLPAATRPMAHPDPEHIAESARHMARPPHKTPRDWLGAPQDGDLAGPASGAAGVAPGGLGGSVAFAGRSGGSKIGAQPSVSASLGRVGRRLVPREARRREVVAVLTLLVAASLFSITGPIAGAGSMSSSPSAGMVAGDVTTDPTESPATTPGPDGTPALGPASPDPTAIPTLKPKVKAPPKKTTPKPIVVQTFVALGDSLTAWPDIPWPSRLDAEDAVLRLIHNAGVPGNTTAEMRARLTKDVYDYNPNVVFVLGGTNDLGLGISGSATIANLRAIILGAKAHKIKVVMLLVPPDSYTSMAARVNSLNAAIINLCNSQRVTYVDIHAPLANANGVYYPQFTSDGLHFTNLGAQTVANTIRARIRRIGL
jgi:lysophospholipase L1-like esterase